MMLEQNPVTLLLLLGLLSLLPLAAIATTSFLKISIVLVLLRNALGVQQAPSTLALNAIALATTMLVMAPTFDACFEEAKRSTGTFSPHVPQSGEARIAHALAVLEPLRQFMLHQSRPEARERFVDLARRDRQGQTHSAVDARDWRILVPSFVVSELQAAFEIGLLLFIPFVVLDLLVSNVLLTMGMQMVPPMMVSLPLKLLLFVAADGWGRLLQALVLSYRS